MMEKHRNKLYANASEQESSAQQQELFQQYYAMNDVPNTAYTGFAEFNAPIRPPRSWPLPVGQKLARPDLPLPRSDWKDMKVE